MDTVRRMLSKENGLPSSGDRTHLEGLAREVEHVRSRLIWLSAQAANLRALEATRALAPIEEDEVAELLRESDELRQTLQTLRRQFDDGRVPASVRLIA